MWTRLRRHLGEGHGQAGFTLVEVIVMITVTVIGVMGTLAVANLAVRTSDTNEQRVAGVNLAREGVELVRAMRDSNWAAKAEGSGVSCWDYYPMSQLLATGLPFTLVCADFPGLFGRMSSLATPTHFIVHPNIGNGMPWLTQVSSGSASATTNSGYRLCPDARNIYAPAGASCASGQQPFYRRVTITRGKAGVDTSEAGNPTKYAIRVQAFVTWPGNTGSDVRIEEYLTDWRKF